MYEASFADRDITTQDWATFINFLLPAHMDATNSRVAEEKMKAELLDRRFSRLTVDSNISGRSMDAQTEAGLAEVDAQLGLLAPREKPQDHVGLDRRRVSLEKVTAEWNEGFFDPRGVHLDLILNFPEPSLADSDPSIVNPDQISLGESLGRSSSWETMEQQTSHEHIPGAFPREPIRPSHYRRHTEADTANTRQGRGWGYGPNGPGHYAGRTGTNRNNDGGHSCQHNYRSGNCGSGCSSRNRARTNQSENAPRGLFSATEQGVKIGPFVADPSGVRIGNFFSASEDGVKIGSTWIPGGGRRGHHPGQHQPRGAPPPPPAAAFQNHQDEKKDLDDSEHSETESESEHSEASLIDIDDVRSAALPLLRRSLLDWINHPDQPVTQQQMDALQRRLDEIPSEYSNPELQGAQLKALKAEIKGLSRAFKDMKRCRRNQRRAERKARRSAKRAERQAKRAAKKAEHTAQKAERGAERTAQRAAKGKGKARCGQANRSQTQLNSQHQGFVPPQPAPNLTNFPLFNSSGPAPTPPTTLSNFLRGTPNVHLPMPLVPPLPGSFPTSPNGSPHGSLVELHTNRLHLLSEAERFRSDAAAYRASAEEMRKAGMDKDVLKLEEEARRLEVESDGLVAQASQLEENALVMEEEERRGEGRSYLARMRMEGGVSI